MPSDDVGNTISDHNHGNGLIIHKRSYSKLLSKEASQPNSSCRIYYGEASGSIPFVWESQPGTPKHALFESSSLPPLTPPPSYASASAAVKRTVSGSKPSSIFRRGRVRRHGSFSLSSLSSSSSCSSSSAGSAKARSASRSPVPLDYDDHDDNDVGDQSPGSSSSPTSTLCFPAVKKSTAWRFVSDCYAVKNRNG